MSSISNKLSIIYLFFLILVSTFYFGQDTNPQLNGIKSHTNKTYFYSVISDSIISKDKILMLKYYDIPSMNPGQFTISYDYCTSLDKCKELIRNNKSQNKIAHYEMTGVIIDKDKFWMHPPRSDNFRILEMNAFPYVEFKKNIWNYELDFGNHWGDKKWIEWEGRRKSESKYKATDTKTIYRLENKDIECIEIETETIIPNLGNTNSVFYYNRDYGFLRMIFNTIDKKKIEFNLVKVIQDADL